MFTEKELVGSEVFKKWITGRVSLIHNIYDEEYPTYIVLHSDMGRWTINRFFKSGDQILTSSDYVDISTEEVFKVLLSKYSQPLDN